MTQLRVEIGQRIVSVRKRIKMTQTELGDIVGLKGNVLSKYELGDVHQKAEALVKIAEVGKVSLDWLLTGKEFIKEKPDNIAATIHPGTKEAAERITANSTRATVSIPHLKWVVEWMDNYFTNDSEQALLFYEQLRDDMPSFKEYIARVKKKSSGVDNAEDSKIVSA